MSKGEIGKQKTCIGFKGAVVNKRQNETEIVKKMEAKGWLGFAVYLIVKKQSDLKKIEIGWMARENCPQEHHLAYPCSLVVINELLGVQ